MDYSKLNLETLQLAFVLNYTQMTELSLAYEPDQAKIEKLTKMLNAISDEIAVKTLAADSKNSAEIRDPKGSQELQIKKEIPEIVGNSLLSSNTSQVFHL